ncbi:MAG TPA: hypothetical protein PKA60_01055 [Candidatus Paceibacterota bacterium]|nr:hypothetical protein [Candidatus Paceibacterota bacterium]
MTKKTAIIILIVAAVLAGFFVLYMILFTSSQSVVGPVGNIGRPSINVFPLGNQGEQENNNGQQVAAPELSNLDPKSFKLRRITNNSIAGFYLYDEVITIQEEDKEKEQEKIEEIKTNFRFIEKSTGNVFEASSKDLFTNRITNTTIPKIQEATFFNNGNGVVLRYLSQDNSIETFVANIIKKVIPEDDQKNSESEEGTESDDDIVKDDDLAELKGIFLTKDIDSITKSPTSNSFFYTKSGKGYIFDATSPQNQRIVLDQSITELVSEWNNRNILLTTKASGLAQGISFSLAPTGGQLNRLISEVSGLTTKANSNGTVILYSQIAGNSLFNFLYNTETRESSLITLSTLPEKCVWSKKNTNIIYCAQPKSLYGTLPDEWYQGIVSFEDSMYKIDTAANTVVRIADFPVVLDIIEPKLSESENYIVFMNKSDLTLWSLNLE